MEKDIIKFLRGDASLVTDRLKREIQIESDNLRYEKALNLKRCWII